MKCESFRNAKIYTIEEMSKSFNEGLVRGGDEGCGNFAILTENTIAGRVLNTFMDDKHTFYSYEEFINKLEDRYTHVVWCNR